ncbi:hypothetical protein [Paraburkholderia hospita]|uniref:hypothetical protein n=1 Tax=Paraburkholderia hospita TaxID=169430 RepID=UPI0002716190|nr:hypothetical protein [Paraburkholderia hospita]EUC15015.1 hypothetical protein PMI06_006191 [Burkholderia sp. BT03]SKC94371.1 hypothetical protein SAMN06266956_6249 [Paraburkholderia hospita]
MKRTRLVIAGIAPALALTACGGVNQYLADRSETTELYHIFDIKTTADIDTVATAAADGLAQNTNRIQQNRPLMMSTAIPAQPGRFQLIDAASALAGTGMGAFLQAASSQAGNTTLRIAKCDGAVWTSKATRAIPGYNNLNLYSCLYAYKGGYHLDVYGVFQKNSGGLAGLEQGLAGSLVGTPDQWVNKTIMDTVRNIASVSHAQVVQIEGQPKIAGDQLPWVDKLSVH